MSSQPQDRLETPELRRRLRRAALLTAGAGIGFGLLTILSWWLLSGDREAIAAAEDPMALYVEDELTGMTVAGLYLLPFAAILFLWFIVALRRWIRRSGERRNMLISDLQLVSGVAFTCVFLVGSGAVATAMAISTEGGGVSYSALRTLDAFGSTLVSVMGVRMAGIFVLSTSTLGMTTGVLPRWFNFVGYGFGGLLLLSPMVEANFTLAFPLWVLVLSVMLLYHLANVPDDDLPGFVEQDTDAEDAAPAGAD